MNLTANQKGKRRGTARPRRGTQISGIVRLPSGQVIFIRTKQGSDGASPYRQSPSHRGA